MSNEDLISVEVAFALPNQQLLRTVAVEAGATVQDAIDRSGLSAEFPDESIESLPTGIWGRAAARDHVLHDGDRVEVYRPLEMDPREARRHLARLGMTMDAVRKA